MPTPSVSFVVHGLTPPSVNHAYKHACICGHLRSYQTEPLKAFKRAIAAAAQGLTVAPECPRLRRKVCYEVQAHVYLGKAQRGDIDNVGKALCDGLVDAGVIHSDDRVKRIIFEKHTDQRENPRTEITVSVF